MRAVIVAALALAGVAGGAAAAPAQSWRPIARQCAKEINAKVGCGSCGGLWWAWAECTVARVYGDSVPRARVEWCVQRVYADRLASHACNACGDPVDDVLRCIGGR